MTGYSSKRGFTLLIALVLSTVAVSITLALTTLAYKGLILSSGSQQSQQAFYAADTVLECALLWDNGAHRAFRYSSSQSTQADIPVYCAGINPQGGTNKVPGTLSSNGDFTIFESNWFSVEGSRCGQFIVYKANPNDSSVRTAIYANGVNTSCEDRTTDPRAIERSLRAIF
ncbi:MAG: hypothetical protein WAV21_03425 [Minisyncoccia bacterium]